MADGDERLSENFRMRLHNSSNSEDSEGDDHVALDLGVNLNKTHGKVQERSEVYGASASGLSDPPKKEENPFSFKHFLRSDKSYQNQGARPKVYCEGRPISSISDVDLHQTLESKQTRIIPEFSSALPDFVQDHLVIEQCYLGKELHNNFNVDVNNLPDFTPSRSSLNINRLNVDSNRDNDVRSDNSSNNIVIPLDLPVRPPTEFPLDLPIVDPEPCSSRNYPQTTEVGVSKSLPDFLADGAVRTQQNDSNSAVQSPEWETERLLRELEYTRRMMNEQAKRADVLQRDLEAARHKEEEFTQNFVKSLEHAEENLGRSMKRAASAENTILKLRQEIKLLTSQVNELQRENLSLRSRDEGGAAGGPNPERPSEMHSQRLALELRTAANTAEHSLRQLLTGVDNLRIMAATLENMHRIEERTDKFLDIDDEAGPAL